jgi:hypothetical protein
MFFVKSSSWIILLWIIHNRNNAFLDRLPGQLKKFYTIQILVIYERKNIICRTLIKSTPNFSNNQKFKLNLHFFKFLGKLFLFSYNY